MNRRKLMGQQYLINFQVQDRTRPFGRPRLHQLDQNVVEMFSLTALSDTLVLIIVT
jgi:hypothetical protein